MKKNDIKENKKEKNGFLITWVSCIVVLLILCFFGVSDSMKGTYSASCTGTNLTSPIAGCACYSYKNSYGDTRYDCSGTGAGTGTPSTSSCDNSCTYQYIPSGYTCTKYTNGCGKTCYKNCVKKPDPSSSIKTFCSDHSGAGKSVCESEGCYWDDNIKACSNIPIINGDEDEKCYAYVGKYDCEDAGCNWNDDTGMCSSNSNGEDNSCSRYSGTGNMQNCINAGCSFDISNNQCSVKTSEETKGCYAYVGKYDCEDAGCNWNEDTGMCLTSSGEIEETKSCSSYNNDPTGCVLDGCNYDSATNICSAKTDGDQSSCSSYSGSGNMQNCINAGCTWNTSNNNCSSTGGNVSCYNSTSQGDCEALGCSWSNYNYCRPKNDSEIEDEKEDCSNVSGTACYLYSSTGRYFEGSRKTYCGLAGYKEVESSKCSINSNVGSKECSKGYYYGDNATASNYGTYLCGVDNFNLNPVSGEPGCYAVTCEEECDCGEGDCSEGMTACWSHDGKFSYEYHKPVTGDGWKVVDTSNCPNISTGCWKCDNGTYRSGTKTSSCDVLVNYSYCTSTPPTTEPVVPGEPITPDIPNPVIPSSSKPSSSSDGNVTVNPQTGEIVMFMIWILGFGAVGYSIWYYMKNRKES